MVVVSVACATLAIMSLLGEVGMRFVRVNPMLVSLVATTLRVRA